MQAVAHMIDRLNTQLPSTPSTVAQASRLCLDPVITPELPTSPRWSESPTTGPLCDSEDDLDEDEAYFLGDEDDNDDDDDLDDEDDYDDDDDGDLDDDEEDLDDDVNLDEEDF